MNIFIVDTETTGLMDHDEIIELAIVVLNLTTNKVIACGSTLVASDIPNSAEHINGITPEMISTGIPPEYLSLFIQQYLAFYVPKMVVAHNADFDKMMFDRHQISFEIPWVCSKDDLALSASSLKLSHIAVDLGLPVVNLHRALDDTQLLAEVLMQIPNIFGALVEALKPKALFKADVVYHTRQLAKDAHFRWDGDVWVKKLPRDTPLEKVEGRPFRLVKLHDV